MDPVPSLEQDDNAEDSGWVRETGTAVSDSASEVEAEEKVDNRPEGSEGKAYYNLSSLQYLTNHL